VAAGTGLPRFSRRKQLPGAVTRRGDLVPTGRVHGTDTGGSTMFGGLVWRTILFFGLTAGYTVVAALVYSI